MGKPFSKLSVSSDQMGVPTNEEEEHLQPGCQPTPIPHVNDCDPEMLDYPKKKKIFSSSSFYEEPNAIYPTVEEQVEMCRKIADSLSDDCNKKSKGANMFFKRVKKAEKWIVESEEESLLDGDITTTTDVSKMSYVRVSKDPPKLSLILDPRRIIDMQSLKQEGISIVEHSAVSPDICHDIIKDLNSPTGKGAQLFAKRKKKSEDWVVDEEKVKAMLRERHNSDGWSSPEPTLPIKPLTHPRVQMIKSPWTAAMESPIGCCDGAFKPLVSSDEVADSVIRAAEAKIMTYPSPRMSVLETVSSQMENTFEDRLPQPVSPMPNRADILKCRSPRGWGRPSHATASQPPLGSAKIDKSAPFLSPSPQTPPQKLTFLTRSHSFNNFNNMARAWSPETKSSPQRIKSVRPPSLLIQ